MEEELMEEEQEVKNPEKKINLDISSIELMVDECKVCFDNQIQT